MAPFRWTIAASISMLLLAACQSEVDPSAGVTPGAPAVETGQPAQSELERIAAELHQHIAELASDAYEGREPGTPGEDKTVAYLVKTFEALGLKPGNGESWTQEVPITAVTTDPGAVLSLRGTERHELACSNCGAPLHEMKMLRSDADGDRELVRTSRVRQPKTSDPRRKKKKKKNKSLKHRFFEEVWDAAEDLFDIFD